jgi:hypothetical protein
MARGGASGAGRALTGDERTELATLRREVQQLRQERVGARNDQR